MLPESLIIFLALFHTNLVSFWNKQRLAFFKVSRGRPATNVMFLCNSVFKKPFVVGTLVLSVVVLERSIRFAGGINSLICLFCSPFWLQVSPHPWGGVKARRWGYQPLRGGRPAVLESPSACINRWPPWIRSTKWDLRGKCKINTIKHHVM